MALEGESDLRKRKRTSHACDSCRHRKVRCDGRQLCATCSSTGDDCVYGAEAIPKSKSDLILEVALRSENMLREMSAQLRTLLGSASPVGPRVASSQLAFFSPTTIESTHRPGSPPDQMSNVILPQSHSSVIESILAWPHFKDFQTLRENYRGSVFGLESLRPSFKHSSSGVLPYVSKAEVDCILQSFERNVNFWYPTLSRATNNEIELRVLLNSLDEGISSCLALLVMALGCASELIRLVTTDSIPDSAKLEQQHRWQQMSSLYFDLAFKKIHLAQSECTTEAAQRLFFTALFFAFLQRPIQGWSFISAAAIKCRLLLSYPTCESAPEHQECLRRIFWSCYILESDYLAELAALPKTGIADIESSIPLPGKYRTHASPVTEEQSSLYFLACISMCRLLNRAHDLLYARSTGVGSDINQFPSIVAELNCQLNIWKDILPPPLQFSVNRDATRTIEGGVLRQRYLACKSVIYRPYLTWALSLTTRGEAVLPMVYEGCKTCLEACCLHAQNLQSFPQTVMVDTWIASLSMASVMLITLATARESALRSCLPLGVTEIGPNLSKNLTQWMQVPGHGVSPSVLQSIRLIEDVGVSLQAISKGSAHVICRRDISATMDLKSYPRPDWIRGNLNWASLNGPWSFIFDDSDSGLSQRWHITGLPTGTDTTNKHARRDIIVPYAFQTSASGINLQEAHEVIWYERMITDVRKPQEISRGNRLLLRFGAVDYECSVWVDGHIFGKHRGGQVPFDLDVTDAFSPKRKSARLTMRVRDSLTDLSQPRGKQYWGPVPESIFYTPTSGIWQSVWLESVPRMRICDSSGGTAFRPDIENGKLEAKIAVTGRQVGENFTVAIMVLRGEGKNVISRKTVEMPREKNFLILSLNMRVDEDSRRAQMSFYPFNIDECWYKYTAVWTPEIPILHDVTVSILDENGTVVDEVGTTFGMRSISWQEGDGKFRLNGKPYFQSLVLDQGYWPETGLTPPSSEALKADIQMAKATGFNGCRKHQKVEDPAFLYWADKLGYLVWGEIGNAYEFNDEYIDRFNDEWTQVVKRDRNHASLVVWTPVNESWGYKSLKDNIHQRNHIRSLYYLTKTLDPTRPINDNCGWEHVVTDLTTYHDYSDSADLAKICSKLEGGILSKKLHGEMFTEPILSGSTPLDHGSAHKPGAPIICSEFGGVNIAPAKDKLESSRDWGYTTAANPNDLLARQEKLIMAVVKGGHSCGFVYTQLTDIEQEVNGLYSYDRRAKVPAERVRAIMVAAREYYYKHVLSTASATK